MITPFARNYRKTSSLNKLFLKIFLGIFLVLGIFGASSRFSYAQNIPFESTLPVMFSWLNIGYYSNTHFKFGGNNFVGIIFWQSNEILSTPEIITINGGAQGIQCTERLRGIYYNNQRGRRIWPLDTGNLAILSGQGSGYETMTMTNGFFTNCTPLSGLYIPLSNEIYGQIDHYLSGQNFRMIAGINYNFPGNTFAGLNFGPTLKIILGVHKGFIFDTDGGIAELDMNVPWCQNFTSSPSLPPIIVPQGTNGMIFMCNGQSVSGYILNIFLSGGTIPYATHQVFTNANSYTRLTGAGLATGDYFATCTVLGPSGIGPQCGNTIPFRMGALIPACNPNFQGEITFAAHTGNILISQGLGTYYTNTTGIVVQLAATDPTNFSVSGDFLGTPRSGTYLGNSIFNYIVAPIALVTTNGWNYFSSTYTTGSCNYSDAPKRIYVDTVPPTAPYIFNPIHGANFCPSLPLTLSRSGSLDTGAGLSHYRYEIYNNNGMITGLVLSGSLNISTSTVLLSVSSLPLGTYSIRMMAIDNVGMISNSNTVTITLNTQYCTAGTGVIIVTPVIWLRNLDLSKVYRSDPILVLGLTGPTLVSVSKGMLFINNASGGSTTGIITSSDITYIELVSSDTYDTTVTSTINVLGLTGTFSLTTKKNACSLTATEKLTINTIYTQLKAQYNNDLSKLSDFLNTFQSMVKDESLLSKSCNVEYLLALVQADFGGGGIDTSNHIAPNCKIYSIGYDVIQKAYYAPQMANRYYFINRESLIRHLDYYNPGDCNINTYATNYRSPNTTNPMKHTAPNGKIYNFQGQYGGFTAAEFTRAKYFDSLESIIRYVNLKNPPKDIWTHTVNTSFTPITYAAPNGREYKIYKTDRGFMSYKLMHVRYYDTISSLKKYIDKNNPSKR